MENIVQWAKELKQELGNNLVSVILYGSAVRGEYVRARSDLNLMLVFKKLDLQQITKIGQLMPRKVRKQAPQLVFWTEAEIGTQEGDVHKIINCLCLIAFKFLTGSTVATRLF